MALSANSKVDIYATQEVRRFEVEAAKHIYRGALVGRHFATGYARPFAVGDEFIGISTQEVDNTSGANGALSVDVIVSGDFAFALTGVTRLDVNAAVFATADNAIALNGHSLGFLGRVIGVEKTSVAIIRLKVPGELPAPTDTGTLLCRGGPFAKATGNNGGGTEYIDGDGCILASTLGLGVIPAAQGGFQLSIDDTDEASHASLRTHAKFDVDKGLVLVAKIAAYSTSGVAMTGANVDLHFGLADAVVYTAVDPTYHCLFQVDGAGTTLNLGADDDSVDVPESDTGLELPITLATAVRYVIIIRGDGKVEVWAGTTQVTAPSLAAIDFTGLGNLCGFVNIEKSSAVGIGIVEVPKFAVYGGV